jgi:effector-binding domain-containing protein
MDYKVELKDLERQHVAVVKFRATPEEIGEKVGAAFQAVVDHLAETGGHIKGPAFAVYDQTSADGFDVSAGFPVLGPIEGDGHVVPAELPACQAAVTEHIGGYDELPQAYEAIGVWMRANGRHARDTTMWEEYWSEPSSPPEETRTVVIWPLKPL